MLCSLQKSSQTSSPMLHPAGMRAGQHIFSYLLGCASHKS
jgi:hypothetical protein